MSEIKLKPCPFCGGKARIGKRFSDMMQWSLVGCEECFSSGKAYEISAEYSANEMAAKAWNRRDYWPSEQERWLEGK